MIRVLRFTPEAESKLEALTENPAFRGILKQVRKALGYLETNPQHPSLNVHKYSALEGANGEQVWEAYAQNNTPGAYRIFFHYGPDEKDGKKRIAVISIIAITPHP